jgi:hypothetical protein
MASNKNSIVGMIDLGLIILTAIIGVGYWIFVKIGGRM